MKSISVLKPTGEVLRRVKRFLEHHGYKNIIVNYKAFTLTAEKFGLFSRKKYVDINFKSPQPVISVIEMKVHSRKEDKIMKEREEEQKLHDKIFSLF